MGCGHNFRRLRSNKKKVREIWILVSFSWKQEDGSGLSQFPDWELQYILYTKSVVRTVNKAVVV